MQRRSFLKGASVAALGSIAARRLCAAPVPRIAFGGIGIECSTYSHIRTRMEDFAVLRGEALRASTRFAFLKRHPVPFLPTLVATATPGGPVERRTYDALKAEFLDRLRALLPLDGLYLPMHGAMFVEGMQDAEGDWYTAARELVGPRCLLSASYDLHGNISQRIIDHLDMLSAFRTAPHIDREDNQAHAAAAACRRELEICAETLQACEAALAGGADRIELCSALSEGGVTPSHGLLRAALACSKLPIHILLSPRGGNFVYSEAEFAVMRDDLQHAASMGVAGFCRWLSYCGERGG